MRAGRAHWDATYTYSATGRRVDNRIDATFAFRDGLIVRHDDRFDLWRWARQALGVQGRAARLAAARAARDPRAGGEGARRVAGKRDHGATRRRIGAPDASRSAPTASQRSHATFRPEPPFAHDRAPRVGVLLVNLGTPDAPTPAAVRRYLAEFLSDPRVVEIPRVALEADPARRHPAHAPGALGDEVRGDLDARTARRCSCTA